MSDTLPPPLIPYDLPDISGLGDDRIIRGLRACDETMDLLKAQRAAGLAELNRRHGAAVLAQLTADGKEYGSTRYFLPAAGADVYLRGEVKRTVKWDSQKLLHLALSMPEAEARRVFKFDLSVPERAFNEATGNFRAALEDARTTTVGALTLAPAMGSMDVAS